MKLAKQQLRATSLRRDCDFKTSCPVFWLDNTNWTQLGENLNAFKAIGVRYLPKGDRIEHRRKKYASLDNFERLAIDCRRTQSVEDCLVCLRLPFALTYSSAAFKIVWGNKQLSFSISRTSLKDFPPLRNVIRFSASPRSHIFRRLAPEATLAWFPHNQG